MSTRDITIPEKGHATFVIKALWLHGMSVGNIANACGRSPGAVRGIVLRKFDRPRDEMTVAERQAALDAMKEKRLDGNVLPDRYFIAMPLAARQMARKYTPPVMPTRDEPEEPQQPARVVPAKPKAEPNPNTREGRKEIKRLAREEEHRRKKEEADRAIRELGGNERRGVQGAAFEYLHSMNLLADPEEKRGTVVSGLEMSSRERRKESGRVLRDLIEGCRVGGLSGVDLEKVSGAGGTRLGIPAYRLQCIMTLGAIKAMMPDRDYELIESVVDADVFAWESVPSSTGRSFIYEAIRRALDVVAVHERFMNRETFRARWGYDLPNVQHFDRDDAVDLSSRAEEVLLQAR